MGSAITLSLSVVSNRVQLQPNKVYRLCPSVECFFKFGDQTVVATTSEHLLPAKQDPLALTGPQNSGTDWIAGIVSSGTGVLFLSELEVGIRV
jgi:hypothetical protein